MRLSFTPLVQAFVAAGLLQSIPGLAQDVTATASGSADVQRVEVTGSSIKRIVTEGALPVQIFNEDDISGRVRNRSRNCFRRCRRFRDSRHPRRRSGARAAASRVHRSTASARRAPWCCWTVIESQPGPDNRSPGRVQASRNADGSIGAPLPDFDRLSVRHYATVDWQTRYSVTQRLDIVAGLLNVFDTKPPLTLKQDAGVQVGYDERYADPRGRTLMADLTWRF